MEKQIELRGYLILLVAAVWALSCGRLDAEPLRLVASHNPPIENLRDDKAPGFSVEVLKQVFAAMGQEASFEEFPWGRGWMMVLRGERDGMFTSLHTGERERICSFPDEPLKQERWVFFVRTANIERLHFTSFDDLVGHDVAIHMSAAGVYSQPTVSPELWKFLREHHNMVETLGNVVSFRMLSVGRVDYALANLSTGMWSVAEMGLSGKIEPLLSHSVIEEGIYVCFSKERVSPALVDAFSRALKQFKQTEAFQAILHKYFP
jgi:polar amino acid transport system substrate-binding protein